MVHAIIIFSRTSFRTGQHPYVLINDQGAETECTLSKPVGDPKLGEAAGVLEGRAAVQLNPQ